MNQKIHIALIFGGKSVEHRVSLQSARNVAAALAPEKYCVHFIGIDEIGNWHHYSAASAFENGDDPETIRLGTRGAAVNPFDLEGIDVVFPVLHGTFGEDGTIQGLLRLADLPFVGADVLGSAIGMDKEVSKRLAEQAGIASTAWKVVRDVRGLTSDPLNFPLFVKPVMGGSSVGIAKVVHPSNLSAAVQSALRFSEKVLLEECVEGREIQVAVMGDERLEVSLPCEIIPKGEFHSYASKYIDPQGAEFLYPAPLDADETARVQQVALELYRTLCCESFARVDLFLLSSGTILFNEINTIPGLTHLSPYTKMWRVSGLEYSVFLDRLIDLAFRRYERQKRLVHRFEADASKL